MAGEYRCGTWVIVDLWVGGKEGVLWVFLALNGDLYERRERGEEGKKVVMVEVNCNRMGNVGCCRYKIIDRSI